MISMLGLAADNNLGASAGFNFITAMFSLDYGKADGQLMRGHEFFSKPSIFNLRRLRVMAFAVLTDFVIMWLSRRKNMTFEIVPTIGRFFRFRTFFLVWRYTPVSPKSSPSALIAVLPCEDRFNKRVALNHKIWFDINRTMTMLV